MVIVPAFNEEANIGHTLSLIPENINVVIIDDGSIDKTVDRCVGQNMTVLRHEKNLGYEKAIGTGINYFKKMGYQRCIVLDADGEIDVGDAIRLLDNVSHINTVICGYRVNNFGRISEKIVAIFSYKIFGIRDIFCGCKGLHMDAIRDVPDEILTANAFSKFVTIHSRRNSIMNFPVSGKKRNGISNYGKGLTVELSLLAKFLDNIYAYFNTKI